MYEEEWNENRGDTDRYEPFIADVTRRMKHESLRRQFVIELFDQRFECSALKPQAKRRRRGVREGPGRSVLPSRHLPCLGRYQSALARQLFADDKSRHPPVRRLSSTMSSAPRKCCDG